MKLRHASVVRHGLLKLDTIGAVMSRFLCANVPGLVFPSAFLAACKLATHIWLFSFGELVGFFPPSPSWAQLYFLVLIPCKMT